MDGERDPGHSGGLTPAQEREARRKLRRALGDGTPEEQTARLIRAAFERRATSNAKRAARKIGGALADILFNALRGRK